MVPTFPTLPNYETETSEKENRAVTQLTILPQNANVNSPRLYRNIPKQHAGGSKSLIEMDQGLVYNNLQNGWIKATNRRMSLGKWHWRQKHHYSYPYSHAANATIGDRVYWNRKQ